jgi:hypothetical protein
VTKLEKVFVMHFFYVDVDDAGDVVDAGDAGKTRRRESTFFYIQLIYSQLF